MLDVKVSLKKIILDSYAKYMSSTPITFKFSKKESEVTSYKVTLVESVVEGSTQFSVVDYSSSNVLDVDLVGLTLKDDSYGDNYNVIAYDKSTGMITISTPLLRDFTVDETFVLDVVNVVKIFEDASYIDRTAQTVRGLRVKIKPFDITISCKDDDGQVADKIGTWLTYILSNEHYKVYDENGNSVGGQVFYIYKQPMFEDVGREVNNSLYYGRVNFKIYESYCDSLNNL